MNAGELLTHSLSPDHATRQAAEQALAGDPRALHDRLRLHRESAATDARIVRSDTMLREQERGQ